MNYRESINKMHEIRYVHKKQSGGSGQFADIAIRFEPGEPGSGFEFVSEIKARERTPRAHHRTTRCSAPIVHVKPEPPDLQRDIKAWRHMVLLT